MLQYIRRKIYLIDSGCVIILFTLVQGLNHHSRFCSTMDYRLSCYLYNLNNSAMIRCLARRLYHMIGWRLEGRYPSHIKKKVIIVAPHTSAIDFPIGILVKFWLNIKATFYAKEELFKGVVGLVLRLLGGMPVDRSKNTNLVGQAVSDFNNKKEHTILITPEGTRKKVKRFKSGFYYIAQLAQVPIVPIAFDYGRKVIQIMPTYHLEGNGAEEIEFIRGMFKGIKGKNPEYSIT